MDVIPGSRIADRLGSQVAISSHPIVVNPREGGVREAIRTYVREAPRTIERTAGADSERLAPVLARDRSLPPDTVSALRDRAVVAEHGRLGGRTAGELAPRGAIVEGSRGPSSPGTARTGREPVTSERWRAPSDRGGNAGVVSRERAPVLGNDRPQARVAPRSGADESWRARGEGAPRERSVAPERSREPSRSDQTDRPSVAPPSRPAGRARGESFRSRSDTPPARRVIEGAVPGRRAPESRYEGLPRSDRDWRTRDRGPASSPPPPPSRVERAPAYSPPPAHVDRGPAYAPPPRVERAPAYSAPPPRTEPRHEGPPPRSAPAPRSERERPH
jgi:hypothetical protein